MASSTNKSSERMSVKEFLADKRACHKIESNENISISMAEDPYLPSLNSKNIIRKPTAYIWLPSCSHKNVWDPNHPECPERSLSSHKRLEETGLLDRCQVLNVNDNKMSVNDICSEYIALAHDSNLISKVKDLCTENNEKSCTAYDSIFYNGKESFQAAVDAVRASIVIAESIINGECQNGFANIRPPGHHATKDTPNGYCFFNNVAITAKYLLKRKVAKKILIVDFDVHHGQGTQRCFYETDNVLYFSIHRYENGTFWPNLRESDCDYIGSGKGTGYNVNVPLNDIGLRDSDYISIILNILLPIAYEYGPDFVLVSSGYDACIGCPEGLMKVSPAFYGHIITLLSGLAKGRILCLLEGGYCVQTMSEAVVMTVQGLLGEQCNFLDKFSGYNPSVVNTINDVKFYLKPYWKCFGDVKLFNCKNPIIYDKYNQHVVVSKFYGVPETPPHPTRLYYPVLGKTPAALAFQEFINFKVRYHYNKLTVGYVYGDSFLKHNSVGDSSVPERPERLKEIMSKLIEFKLLERMTQIPFNPHDEEMWIQKVHSKAYFNLLLEGKVAQTSDLYTNIHTPESCLTAIRAVLCLVDAIQTSKISSGVAIVRPPGHHAKEAEGRGFCHINNIVVAANYLTETYKLSKVLIVDFDIHHGDGTQSLTYDRKDIFYISIHRYDESKFFPNSKEAAVNYLGTGEAFGYNVNIPFNTTRKEKPGNNDYLSVWTKIVLPLAYGYQPDFVLVSAGFDAGVNDPLGFYAVAPETFGQMIQTLKPLGKMAVFLEGGYNLETTSLSMAMCVKALLGDPLPMPELSDLKSQTFETMDKVYNIVKHLHPILQVNKEIADKNFTQKDVEDFVISNI